VRPDPGLIPSLHEIVMYVGGGRPSHFDVNIMAMPFAVAGRSQSLGGQVDTADNATSDDSPASTNQLF
jgi:hypothetical protein